MDEPTNHLDLDSSEALIDALTGYEGTLLFVSHNRSFVNGLATHVWEVKDGRIDARPGDLDDWERRHSEGLASEPGAAIERPGEPRARSDARRERARERERRSQALGPLRQRIAELEARIEQVEREKKQAEALLADPAVFADPARSTALVTSYRTAQSALDDLYGDWERAQEELQRAEATL
jgi:ATP-binding cassette subfamily F protein 3